MYTLIVVMICSMAYIKCPCVIHTNCMLCTGDTELKKSRKVIFVNDYLSAVVDLRPLFHVSISVSG